VRLRPGAPAASSSSTARALSTSPLRDQGGVEADDHARTRRERVHARGRRRLALGEQVVVAERRIPRRAQAGCRERPRRRGQQTGVARRVEVRAVEERVGSVGRLDAVVSGTARVGIDPAAVEHGQRLVELGPLRGVEDVAGHDDGVGREPVDRAHGRGQHLRAERLVRAERGGERAAQAIEERDPRG
jgi:hypothetical protein